ncbi:MAG: cell division protein FtsZ [Bacteroidetes bacterium 4572_128]|nr:MAG: cell division protein FtsZ [Bacteroidetes bacterium 4572_128]
MPFDFPQNQSSIIKVIGVGGGGSNAVNHMYKQGIKDVNFVVCNTDAQALINSPVPVKIQLGESLTEGRGAGNKPDKGRESAIENIDEIVAVLSSNTKMVFITAGMGGGTGTGAAPVIAKAAKEMGILTVAIVTIPFRFEGKKRLQQAVDGIKNLEENVDSLLVINNEKLREIYGDLKLSEAFSNADGVLTTAAKGIAEIITVHGYINVDFADVQTVMTDSGVSIMGSGTAEGEGRAIRAIEEALTSPLLNNNDIQGASNVLLNITSGAEEISMDEVGEITDYVQEHVGDDSLIIWGTGVDEILKDKISVTIVATGFETNIIPELFIGKKKESVMLESESHGKNQKKKFSLSDIILTDTKKLQKNEEKTKETFVLDDDLNEFEVVKSDEKKTDTKKNDKFTYKKKYKQTRYPHRKTGYQNNIEDMENVPAYKRKNVKLKDNDELNQDKKFSKYSLGEDNRKSPKIRKDNSYLHDNVD